MQEILGRIVIMRSCRFQCADLLVRPSRMPAGAKSPERNNLESMPKWPPSPPDTVPRYFYHTTHFQCVGSYFRTETVTKTRFNIIAIYNTKKLSNNKTIPNTRKNCQKFYCVANKC